MAGGASPGSVCGVPVISADFFPTIVEAAGLKPPAGLAVDGESLVPLLRQSGRLKRDSLYWHYPHYHPGGATPYSALRQGDWKLIEFLEDNHVELYSLKEDVGEQNDLAKTMPERAAQLRQQLHAWRRQLGAQMPTPNPDYEPAKASQAGRAR